MTIALVAVAIGVWVIAVCLLACLGFVTQAVAALADMRVQLRSLVSVHSAAAMETRAISVAVTHINDRFAQPWNMLVMLTPPADPTATKH